MGRRGPQPVELRQLLAWAHAWYKAFRLLRDGTEVSFNSMQSMRWAGKAEAQARLKKLARMTDREYLCENFEGVSRTPEEVERICNDSTNLVWAKEERTREIASVKGSLELEKTAEGRSVWRALVAAEDVRAMSRACDRWARLRYFHFNPTFPFHVREHAEAFLSMKGNRRFPHGTSGKADNARLEYLARGMAGIVAGLSPMTGIERLRNMKHDASSPAWDEKKQRCECWRCENDRWDRHFAERNEDVRKKLL